MAQPLPRPIYSTTPSMRPMLRTDTSSPSLKSPRTARFAEATSVDSPIDGGPTSQWSGDPQTPMTPLQHYQPTMQPSDVGFGYIHDNDPARHYTSPPIAMPADDSSEEGIDVHTPLKSAMRTPGAPKTPRLNPLSPTFKEEQHLQKHEDSLNKQQAKDVKVKFRVRVAKMMLRGVNFSCSLIVLSMLAATFTIFNATKSLPPRNMLPPWASSTKPWPQILLIVVASISLVSCLIVFYGYWKGGHKRAEKVGVYYTIVTVGSMIFAIVMWAVSAGILNQSQTNGHGQDLWGWSCKDNKRKQLFEHDVSYLLICRLQNWSLICAIIEIVVECIAIVIYAVVFYRFHSKRALRKSMGGRDTARSALYTARIQHGMDPTGQNYSEDAYSKAEEGYGDQYVSEVRGADNNVEPGKKFALQAAPLGKTGKGTPKIGSAASTPAPGEQNFGSVPIPGSYEEVAIPAASGEHQFEDVPLPGGYSEGHDAHLHGSGQELYNQPQPEHMQAYDPNAETNYYGKAV